MSSLALAIESSARPVFSYLARLSPGSRPAQISALGCLSSRLAGGAHWARFPWQRLNRPIVMGLRAWLVERYAPATVNRMLSALRGVLKECWRAGLMSDSQYHRASDVPPVRSVKLPAGREIERWELEKLFLVLGHSRHGTRNRAILAILMGAGLRRSELAALDCDDIDLETGELFIRAGKGAKERIGWLGPSALYVVQEWVIPDDTGSLFHISASGIYKLICRGARKAGLQPLTPHDFRRTYVTQLLERGADLPVVQALAGHCDISTTARYDRRGERAKKQAAGLIEVP